MKKAWKKTAAFLTAALLLAGTVSCRTVPDSAEPDTARPLRRTDSRTRRIPRVSYPALRRSPRS